MDAHAWPKTNAATRAEPSGVGTFGARDPLAREVKLLGALLGQVIVEQAGEEALDLIELVRRQTIAIRRGGSDADRDRLAADLASVSMSQAEILIRAFSLYFQLTNLAEEKQRVRRLRLRERKGTAVDESVNAAIGRARRGTGGTQEIEQLIGRLQVMPVLTAHPTEARRRTTIVALRRVYRLLDALDDPRLTSPEDEDIRRRLREQISILRHIAAIRVTAPGPLDEVRSAMAFFDESLFIVVPRLYRSVERALADISMEPKVGAFLSFGTWIGGDRDGNPRVTAEVTRETMRIQTEHALRAYENVCRRLSQTITVAVDVTDARLAARLTEDVRDLSSLAAVDEQRFPNEPFRRRFSYMAERIRRTRLGAGGGYPSAAQVAAELDEIAAALDAIGLERVVRGELQDLRWQLDTFGFHGLSLEVRQHSAVHASTLAATSENDEVSPGVSATEVLATFRAMRAIQARYGVAACHRYVISFTHSASDAWAHAPSRQHARAPALDRAAQPVRRFPFRVAGAAARPPPRAPGR